MEKIIMVVVQVKVSYKLAIIAAILKVG